MHRECLSLEPAFGSNRVRADRENRQLTWILALNFVTLKNLKPPQALALHHVNWGGSIKNLVPSFIV